MSEIDWKQVAASRGLHLPDAELARLAAAIEAMEPAYRALVANLTHEVEPVPTVGEEAVEAK
jgi:hypothetical protein